MLHLCMPLRYRIVRQPQAPCRRHGPLTANCPARHGAPQPHARQFLQGTAARYAAANADVDAVALIGAVVDHVAGCERAGAQAVAARSFGRLRAGDDAALEIGVALHVDAVAIVSGKDAALLGHAGVVGVDFAVAVAGTARGAIAHRDLSAHALLLALVRGCVLLALDVQAIGCHVHTAAMHLRAFEGECIARLDGGVAARIAHVRVAPAGAVAVRVALAAVDACGNAKASALYACAQRNSGTEAAGAVAAVLLAVLLRRLQRDALVRIQCGAASDCALVDVGRVQVHITPRAADEDASDYPACYFLCLFNHHHLPYLARLAAMSAFHLSAASLFFCCRSK